VERKLRSRDPRRPAILAQIRWICRHLPAKGILLFLDEQPIAVKAYGGRRYSSRRRLVLDSRQKTRGRFYLFVIYDAQSGRIHWAFLPGKDSHHVCQFMRRVRSWYRGAEVWVALDQDTTHPRKSKETRRMMRRLGLHWTSTPRFTSWLEPSDVNKKQVVITHPPLQDSLPAAGPALPHGIGYPQGSI